MSKDLKTSSLSRQLIIMIILFSSLVTLILTAVQLNREYHHDIDTIEARLQQVESSYQRSIENAIWDLDKKQAQVQINGIHKLPDIQYAEIISDVGFILSSGTETSSEKTIVRQYSLSHTQEGTDYPLGILTVTASLEGAYHQLLNRIGIVLLSNALKTFLVALFIAFLLKRKVIRHLQDVSSFIGKMASGNYAHHFKLDREESDQKKADELDNLSDVVNKLRSNSQQAFSKTRKAEQELRVNIEYLQQLDAISTTLQSSNDPDQRIRNTLTTILKLFDADRAWLLYPNDPEANHYQIPLEISHPDYPGAASSARHIPMTDPVSEMMKTTLTSNQPLIFEPPHPFLDEEVMQEFNVRSQIIIALHPKLGDAWLMGLHQCRHPRRWSDKDKKLFSEIANHLEDPLGNYLYHKKLLNSEARLAEAQDVAHLGHWERDIHHDIISWSDEIFRIFGYQPQSFRPSPKSFYSMVHPEDRRKVILAFRDAMNKPVSAEYRIIRPDGIQRTVSASAQLTKDQNGDPVRIFGTVQDITERKEREYKIHYSEARLAEAQQIAHVGHWEYDTGSKTPFWSDEFFRIIGYEPQSFKPSMKRFGKLIHPDDRSRVALIAREIVNTPVISEYRIIRPDGSYRYISGTVRSSEDPDQSRRIFGIIQDVTKLKEKEREVQESETRLAEAQQIAHIGHWEYDPETRIANWSDEFFRILGYEPQAFTPSLRRFNKRIHPDDRNPAILEARKAMNAPVTNEYRIIRPDGTHRNISNTLWVTKKENGELERTFGIIQDITNRKQLEQKNREQELQLIQADKMSSLGLLVSGVAHEINNPNNLIRINASLLEEMWHDTKPVLDKIQAESSSFLIGGLPFDDAVESIPDMISGLTEGSRRIEHIINDLKNFARRGDHQNLVEISVNEAIESAVRLLQPLIKSKTYYFKLKLADHLPIIVGNLQHLEQIVINLLSNALDAIPDKKHKVSISSFFDSKTSQVKIEIKDNGVGISKSDLKKIFDPFYTTKQATGGTGLGLAISYSLAKEYGGNLSCCSIVDEGATFTVSFPHT